MSSLAVDFLGLSMKNPLIGASGTFGYGLELAEYLDLNQIGAISGKGVSPQPWSGNSGIRTTETPSGMLNCIGLENPGAEVLINHILPKLRDYDVPFIANMVGKTIDEYGECARMLSVPGVDALEVNISCPNVKEGGVVFGTDPVQAAAVTRKVKENTHLPVLVKLSPNVTNIVSIAKAVEAAGADGISLINTLLGMAIDAKTRRPVLGNITGGLSGPAIKPVALRMVWQVSRAVHIPVSGMGGICTGTDVVEFMLAGARTVQIGTATLTSPDAMTRIARELNEWCDENHVSDVNELIGALEI